MMLSRQMAELFVRLYEAGSSGIRMNELHGGELRTGSALVRRQLVRMEVVAGERRWILTDDAVPLVGSVRRFLSTDWKKYKLR